MKLTYMIALYSPDIRAIILHIYSIMSRLKWKMKLRNFISSDMVTQFQTPKHPGCGLDEISL